MGRSDSIIGPWYKSLIKPEGETALLGFTNNNWFNGDLYDLSLGNWEINSNWKLKKQYDTIICLRVFYFCKDPKEFILKCYTHLKKGGKLYFDADLGDHWRFSNYKLGWLKDGEHEWCYNKNNYLWSGVWDDSFLEDPEFKKFENKTKKFGYKDIKKSILEEVPSMMELNNIRPYFKIKVNMKQLWDDKPQLYILLSGEKT